MLHPLLRRLVPVAILLGAAHAQAQVAIRAVRPDPLNPQASVPAPLYSSPLATYRRHTDIEPIAWKEANDTVARIGGWRAYAREAGDRTTPVAPPAAASGSKP